MRLDTLIRRQRGQGRIPVYRMLLCLPLMILFALPAQAEEIDQLLAAVNGVTITEGDLELARNLHGIILQGRNAGASSRNEEIERQINQELMRQELINFNLADEEGNVASRVRSLREAYAPKGGLAGLLRRIGMQESELISFIRLETSILRFVDFRFRPFIAVSREEIESYYANRLTPQLRKSGIPMPPLSQISEKIDAILREEKVNEALEQWVKEVRRNSRIEYFHEPE